MSKKTYELIVTISGAVSAIAIGLVTYFKPQYATAINSSIEIAESALVAINPAYAVAINASIGIGCTAIIEICGQFVKA